MAEEKPEARTEAQKLTGEPVKVILGGTEYDVRPLPIKYSRPWRVKLNEILAELPKYIDANSNDAEQFSSAMKALTITMPDKLVDMFFEYAVDLAPQREAIEEVASDAEFAEAWDRVVTMAFPLATRAVQTMGLLSP